MFSALPLGSVRLTCLIIWVSAFRLSVIGLYPIESRLQVGWNCRIVYLGCKLGWLPVLGLLAEFGVIIYLDDFGDLLRRGMAFGSLIEDMINFRIGHDF